MSLANTTITPSSSDHAASEALGLWEPKRTLTLKAARQHTARIQFLRRALMLMACIIMGFIAWQFINQPAGFDLADNPDESVRMTNPRYSGRTSDNLPYYLTAKEAVTESGLSNAVKLASPILDFYRSPGAAVSKVMAENGVYDDVEKVLQLEGAVDLKTDDGYQCETMQAKILARDKAISGDEPIACEGNFGKVNGNAFDITNNYKTFTFKSGMHALIERDAAIAGSGDRDGNSANAAQLGFAGDSPIAIKAEEARYENAITTLTENVDVRQDGTKITSETMIIRRAEVQKEIGRSLRLGEITTIDARGNFVYKTPEREVRGNRGVYERQKGIITVTGNVALIQPNGSRVTGDKLVYNLQTKSAQFGDNRCVGDGCGRTTFSITGRQ